MNSALQLSSGVVSLDVDGPRVRWRIFSSPAGSLVDVLISQTSVLNTESKKTSVELCPRRPGSSDRVDVGKAEAVG
jgi:hypothetical protein